MAQWAKVAQLAKSDHNISRQIISLLESCQIPINIRQWFASWIEDQPWEELVYAEETEDVRNVLKELLVKVSEREQKPGGDVAEVASLADGRRKLLETFGNSTGNFFAENMKRCLEGEKLVIDSLCQDPDMKRKRPIQSNIAVEDPLMQQKITLMHEQISGLDAMIRNLEHRQDLSYIHVQELTEKQQSAHREGNVLMNNQLSAKIKEISNIIYIERKKLCDNTLVPLASDVARLVLSIWDEISVFKEQQKLAVTCLDRPKDGEIEILDKHCESGSVYMLSLLRALMNTLNIFRKSTFAEDKPLKLLETVIKELNNYIKEHIKRCFIVWKDVPNQTLKVSSKRTTAFRMTVRLLGGFGLNPSASPVVSAELYSEKDLAILEEGTSPRPKPMGVICNGKDKAMEKRPMVVNFSAMRLDQVNRPDRGRGNEDLVTSYKYAIRFKTSVNVMDTQYEINTHSLPLVLVSQTSQECMAKGTLIWDAAFSEKDRKPFEVPTEVEWLKVKRVLNALWKEHTGRGLEEDHFTFIARLIFKDSQRCNFDKHIITEKQLIKDKMPTPQGFSFWKWNWAYMNLCRDHIKRQWQDGLVCGFISKVDARERLQNEPVGSFLIRFSESSIESCQKADFYGFLTVAVLEVDPATTKNRVFFLKDHLTPEDLIKYDLVTILNAFEVEDFMNPGCMKRLLNGLYPNVRMPFEERFQSYLASKQESSKDTGYVQISLKLAISLTDDNSRSRRESFNPMSPSVQSFCAPSPLSSMGSPGTPLGTGSPLHRMDSDNFNENRPTMMVPPMEMQTDVPDFSTIDPNILSQYSLQQNSDVGIEQDLNSLAIIDGFELQSNASNISDEMGMLIGAHGQETMDGRTYRRL